MNYQIFAVIASVIGLQRLGEYLRWGSSLPPALSERLGNMLMTARDLAPADRRQGSVDRLQLRRAPRFA